MRDHAPRPCHANELPANSKPGRRPIELHAIDVIGRQCYKTRTEAVEVAYELHAIDVIGRQCYKRDAGCR